MASPVSGARVVVALFVLSLASSARAADDIAIIKLNDAGPDRPIPIGKSFYIQGTATKEVTRTQVVVVRAGNPFLLGSSEVSCSEIARRLNVDSVDKSLAAQTTTVGKVFPNASAGVRDHAATVSGAWLRGELKDNEDYKLLLSEDKTFYQAGYTYCLYVLESRLLVDDKVIASHLETLGETKAKCQKDAACEHQADKAFDAAIVEALAAVDKEAAAKIRLAANAAVGVVVTYANRRAFFAGSKWLAPSPPSAPRGQPAHWVRIDGASKEDGLARFLANRLTVTEGGLLAAPTPPQPPAPGFLVKYAADGAYVVKQLHVLDDGEHIQIAGEVIDSTHPVKPLTAKTSNVRVAPNVTVRDVILLTEDRIVIGTKVWAGRDLRAALDAISIRSPASDFALVAASASRLSELMDALEGIARSAAHPDKSSPDSIASIANDLQTWLLDTQGFALKVFEEQTNAVRAMVQHRTEWEASKSKVTIKTAVDATRTVATAPIRFDQKSWVFTYLTPMIGYAALDDGFTQLYTGVQLHVWPNPVNEPLWSNGAIDVARAFAIELAFAPKVSSFGPDNRYAGISKAIPPLFVGGTVHLLPYTSLSAGRVFLSKRASSLSAEDPTFDHQWYVGLNVQVNIPDLVRELMEPTTTTKVDK